jgi:hypothetical protein
MGESTQYHPPRGPELAYAHAPNSNPYPDYHGSRSQQAPIHAAAYPADYPGYRGYEQRPPQQMMPGGPQYQEDYARPQVPIPNNRPQVPIPNNNVVYGASRIPLSGQYEPPRQPEPPQQNYQPGGYY